MNGAVWVECDCNLVGGEALIRQFLWGQRYTRDTFGVLSDCFWLPDTFGYSAAIPQIMRGFGVKYFLTTKLAWNDTNTFPYETFTWRGIDGTDVLAHFFVMDTWPDPRGLLERVNGVGYRARKPSLSPSSRHSYRCSTSRSSSGRLSPYQGSSSLRNSSSSSSGAACTCPCSILDRYDAAQMSRHRPSWLQPRFSRCWRSRRPTAAAPAE